MSETEVRDSKSQRIITDPNKTLGFPDYTGRINEKQKGKKEQ
jgi:hypothetical protein